MLRGILCGIKFAAARAIISQTSIFWLPGFFQSCQAMW